MFKRFAQGLVIVLLIIIPVPVGRLFASLFDTKSRSAPTSQPVRKDASPR